MTRSPARRTSKPSAILLVLLLAVPAGALAQSAPGTPAPVPAPAGAAAASPAAGATKTTKKRSRKRGAATVPAGAAPAADKAEAKLPPVDSSIEEELTRCPGRIPPGTRFKWDLRGEVELKDLVAWVTATLCKPVIVPTTLRQNKVQIYAPNTITQPEAYRMFLAALNSMGLTIQPEGNAFILIETVAAKEKALPFIGPDGRVPDNSSFVTKVIRLKDVPTDEVVAVLQRLKSKDGDIIPYPPTQTLIITDQSENIRRMDDIVKLIDQPMGQEKIWVVKLTNTAAPEVAQLLEKIFQPKGGAGGAGGAGARAPGAPRVNLANPSAPASGGESGGGADLSVSLIIPEEKANMLIIVANERTYLRMYALIKRLEQSAAAPVDAASDRVHVYVLANANAEDMATTLSGLGVGVSVSKGKGGVGTTPMPSTHAGTPGAGAGLFEGDVRVAADKPTNSLVIVASGKDYYTLRDIIRRLDNPRRQVYIEATVLEVSLDKARKIGAAFHLGDTIDTSALGVQGQSLLFGGSQPNANTSSIQFNPAVLQGLAGGLRGPAIPGADTILGLPPGTSVPAFGVYIQALQNNNDVNVVSMPHILTSDNEKANIEVGQNLPFPGMLGGLPGFGGVPGGATPGTTTGVGGFGGFGLGFGTSVQRQDVSLKLEITPHVSEDNVRLEIENEISDVASPNYNGLGPATNKRKVKTQVTVRDQQAVVLGGLIKDKITEAVDKVPLLGDIPIIGYLFKFTRRQVEKQNLLIIITPYVIRDPQDLRRIFERKVAERREFLERYSSFKDDRDLEAKIDYRHKRGLLEEINRTALEAEREASDLRQSEDLARGRIIEGPVEPMAPPTSSATPPPAKDRDAGHAGRGRPAPLPPAPPPVAAPAVEEHPAAAAGAPAPARAGDVRPAAAPSPAGGTE